RPREVDERAVEGHEARGHERDRDARAEGPVRGGDRAHACAACRRASQVDRIKHWKIIEGSYENAPDVKATSVVAPPCDAAGKAYRHGRTRSTIASSRDGCSRGKGLGIARGRARAGGGALAAV